MSIKSKFREPMYKEDLHAVIRQVILMSLMGGLLIGSLQLFTVYRFKFDFSWLMLFILAAITANRIKKVIYHPHIIFNLLSVFAFILAYYIMNITFELGEVYLTNVPFSFPLIMYFLNPLPFFNFLNPLNGQFFGVNNILQVVFFLIGIYYAFQYSK